MLYFILEKEGEITKRQTPLEITGGVTLEWKSLTGQTLSNQGAQSHASILMERQTAEDDTKCHPEAEGRRISKKILCFAQNDGGFDPRQIMPGFFLS